MTKLSFSKGTGKTVRTAAVVFFAIVLLLLLISAAVQTAYAKRVYPNTYIGQINIGGLPTAEAYDLLAKHWEQLSSHGFKFQVDSERSLIFPFVTAPGNPDQTYELVSWTIEPDLRHALQFGHERSVLERLSNSLLSFVTSRHHLANININKQELVDTLRENFSQRETPAQDAGFAYSSGRLATTPATTGLTIDYETGIAELLNQLENLHNKTIVLQTTPDLPNITATDIVSLLPQARAAINSAPFTLEVSLSENGRSHDQHWLLPKQTIELGLAPQRLEHEVVLGFSASTTDFLLSVAEDINREAMDAKFEIGDDGKISRFQSSATGRELNLVESLELMRTNLIEHNRPTSSLVVNLFEPQVTTKDANNLGISELIGRGKSNFAGSPVNRRTNIQVSSDKLNGLLIAPGNEFSLVESLKPFTAEAGYVPELVIKGNRLIPEIGGGACQIGTTTFRAALDAGLEITQRRNHSFAVSYYNDENGLPGTDATIYDPAPDFKFRNNSDYHILIQTTVDEATDDLIYEFWGTSDGRQASTTIPVILSRLDAPETKYIETTDLEPGVTECSGSNVPGYHTSFTYQVATAEGELQEETYESRYRPWQRVCLIGVAPPLLDEEGQGEVETSP